MRYNFGDLVERIERIEKRIERHEERESELLDLLNVERKHRYFYNKEITVKEAIQLIPFEIFDLSINGELVTEQLTKNELAKRWLTILYGWYDCFAGSVMITDVRISLRDSLVDIITERR